LYENTTFFSLNKLSDWQQGTHHNLHLSEEGVRLERTVRYGRQTDIYLHQIEGMTGVADLVLGPRGTLLLLDDAANVWMYDYVNKISDSLFPPQHGLFTNQAMLAATSELLVVGERESNPRVTAYSLSNIQAVWEVREWNGQPLCPVALGTDGEHEVYVVVPEQTAEGEDGRIVPAGTALVVLQIGVGGRMGRVLRDPDLRVERDTPLAALWQRFSLQVQHQERWLYLLDGETRRVHVFHGGRMDHRVEIDFPGTPSGLGVDTRGTIYISDGRRLAPGSLDDRLVQSYHGDGSRAELLSGTQGEIGKILYGHRHLLYFWYRAENRIAVLEQTSRIQGAGLLGGAPEGIYFSRALDATVSETIWHKLLVDADLPDETQLRVYYIASDQPEVWSDSGTLRLDHYLHEGIAPLEEKLERTRHLWQGPIVNPRDALLRAQGRYLWLRIEWSGSDRKTPLLKKLRVYYPRVSYLQYLPAVYQQDPQSRDFMERFLSLFGTFFDEMEEMIDHIARCFDADAATGDLLKWLSTWLGIAVDDRWTEDQTRTLLKRAPELYQKRGTREGLQELIEIFTGEKPYLVEFFQYKYLIEKAEIRRTMEHLYGLDPYRFCVLVKPDAVPDERRRAVLQKLIDEERPAFTEAQLIVLEPHLHIGSHAYLGINSFLMEPSLLVLDDKAALPYNTVLVDVDRNSRIGLHSRLGMDSTLE
jgi:phage tail-like protein